MARGRFISESVATDKKLNSLSIEAQLVYMMTIPHLDRDGLIEGDPDVLWGKVCPKRRQFLDVMETYIQEWIDAGLVLCYECESEPVLWFKGFAKNQVGIRYERETPSKFILPEKIRQVSGNAPDVVRQVSGNVPKSSGTNRDQVEVEVKDQVKDQVEVKAFPASQAPQTQDTPQQEMFLAICEAVGWDYKTLAKKDKAQVAQCMGILTKAEYGIEDIRRFMVEIWFHDWRWEKHQQRPTLSQLRQEIGKLRAGVPETIPREQQKGIEGYRAMLARQGIDL